MKKIFISYSHSNKEWVVQWLLPHLEGAGISVHIDFRDFQIGLPILVNVEKAIEDCQKTLLVLTPDWLESEWANFEAFMIQTKDPIGLKGRIIPIMLEECSLPARLSIFTWADFKDSNNWSAELLRLLKQLGVDRSTKTATVDSIKKKGLDFHDESKSASEVEYRAEILKSLTRNTCLTKYVDLLELARSTPGFTVGNLTQLVNRAALYASKRGKKKVDMDDFKYVREKELRHFDESVTSSEAEGRVEILKALTRKINLTKYVNLLDLARSTLGFSADDLAYLVNEAVEFASKSGKKRVGMEDLEYVKDKMLMKYRRV